MELKRHVEENQGYRLVLTVDRNSSLEQQVNKLKHKLQERDEDVARLQDQCDRLELSFARISAKMVNLECYVERCNQPELQPSGIDGLYPTPFAVGKSGRAASFSALPVGMAAHSVHQRRVSVGPKIVTIDRQVRRV